MSKTIAGNSTECMTEDIKLFIMNIKETVEKLKFGRKGMLIYVIYANVKRTALWNLH